MIKIEQADKYRDAVTVLLASENLPVADLPVALENFAITKHGDEVIGVVGLEIYGQYALLRSLAVSKPFRSQGVAAHLLLWVDGRAASRGLKVVYLLTETAPDYFEQKGYQKIIRTDVPPEVQQSSEFSHVCPQSEIVMLKMI